MNRILGQGRSALMALAIGAVALMAANKPAPEMNYRDMNGGMVNLKELTQKGPVVVVFWATCCAPCIQEAKPLVKIYNQYASQGFSVVAVSEDGTKATPKVKQFVKVQKWPYFVVVDNNKELKTKFGVVEVPTLFLIDKNGIIVYSHTGYMPGDEKKLEKEIAALFESK